MTGKLIGIGVGPGDPELLTVKAVKALRKADVLCVPKSHAKPSMALSIVKQILQERKKKPEIFELVFPMTKDESELKKLWLENSRLIVSKAKSGKIIAFITLGDPMLYSTFLYLYGKIIEDLPDVQLEIIPGVTSVTAVAACAKLPLAEKEEILAIIPSDLNLERVSEIARYTENLVLIKCAHRFKELIPVLFNSGFSEESTIALVKRCTLPEEKVLYGKLADAINWRIHEDYFSVAIIKKSAIPNHYKKVEKKK